MPEKESEKQQKISLCGNQRFFLNKKLWGKAFLTFTRQNTPHHLWYSDMT